MKHTITGIIGSVLLTLGSVTATLKAPFNERDIRKVVGVDFDDFFALQVYYAVPVAVVGAALLAWALLSRPK